MHITMLGSYAPYGRRSKQYAWLERDLAGVDRARTPWLIVGMHAPWYNSNTAHQVCLPLLCGIGQHLPGCWLVLPCL